MTDALPIRWQCVPAVPGRLQLADIGAKGHKHDSLRRASVLPENVEVYSN
jgi:hypothetical protein